MSRAIDRDTALHVLNAVERWWSIREAPTATQDVVGTFLRLREQWRAETLLIASPQTRILNPHYQRIIGLGPQVVPMLLAEMGRDPDCWHWALTAITGVNPIPPESKGDLAAVARAWIEWGHENGHLYEPPRVLDARTFSIDASHSMDGGLLGRLLEGKEPLPVAPPTEMSRPWYELLDYGEAETLEIWSINSLGRPNHTAAAGDEVVVGHAGGWTLVEVLAEGDWTIRHPGAGLCRATKVRRNEWDLWKVRILERLPS